MGSKKVLVVGWYGHGNLGDEAFITAFKKLWPEIIFTFSDHVPRELGLYSGIWFGGGSFLDQRISGIEHIPNSFPVAFIGVGLGLSTHPDMQGLLDRAKVIVLRDSSFSNRVKHPFILSDLVYGSGCNYKNIPSEKKMALILMNEHLMPKPNMPEWTWAAYHWFIQEFAQTCDELILEHGYHLEFAPMCVSSAIDDRRAAAHALGRLKQPDKTTWVTEAVTETVLHQKISQANLVITQRLHGAIFSSIITTPFILIGHHDKMSGLTKELQWNGYVDYYGFKKGSFWEAYKQALQQQPLDTYVQIAREKWAITSAIVANRFFS